MKINKILLLFLFVLVSNVFFAQIGIGTTTPKTTLQVKGDPANPYRADGIQIPTLSLTQLNAKSSYVYNYHQDGALIYVNNVTGSTGSATTAITAKGFYYYDSSSSRFKMVGDSPDTTPTTYSVGDFTQGGVVFWVSSDGIHGLVVETQDQGISNWYGAQDLISVPFNHSIDGRKYRDWRMPTKYELDEMYNYKAYIGGFAGIYWSSTGDDFPLDDSAWLHNFNDGIQSTDFKSGPYKVRAVRAF